jgi:3-dehydrosphinganine reductase
MERLSKGIRKMNLADSCAIITGGSSGIGKAVAKQLVRVGANVFLVARRRNLLEAAVDEMKAEASNGFQRFGCFSADVSDIDQVQEAVKNAEAECGNITVLVNSAGVINPGYVENIKISDIEEEIKVNYLGTVYMIKHALNGMMQRRTGWILNVSSLAGLKGLFGYTGYCASKFAIIGFSEALRSEVRAYNLKVSVLCPPDVDTPLYRNAYKITPPETLKISEMGKILEAENVARAAIRGMDKGLFLIIPYRSGKILRFVNALAPSLMDKHMQRIVDRVRRERAERIRSITPLSS